MNIPASTTNNSSRQLQAAQDLPGQTPAAFDKSLDSARAAVDALEPGSPGQANVADPTASVLFQAHSGSPGTSQGLAVPTDPRLALDRLSELRVAGIEASSAMGPFTNGQPLPAGSLQSSVEQVAPWGAGELGSVYGAPLSEQPRIGTRVDVRA